MAYPILGQDARTELCGALITGNVQTKIQVPRTTALRNGAFGLWRNRNRERAIAAKNRERCKRRATDGLLTRSIEHLAKLAVLDHGDDLKLHEVAPHQRELRERPDVVAFEEIETAAEIRSRPPAEQFGTFRGSTAGCLKSPNRLVARFGVRLQGEGQHELQRAFPFSLHGSSLPRTLRAGTRLVARWIASLEPPGNGRPDPRQTETSV